MRGQPSSPCLFMYEYIERERPRSENKAFESVFSGFQSPRSVSVRYQTKCFSFVCARVKDRDRTLNTSLISRGEFGREGRRGRAEGGRLDDL